MPYREKVAWLSLFAMAVTYGPYFVLTASAAPPEGALPNLEQLGRFAVTAVAQMLILGAGRLVLRRSAPEDARAPVDERDRAIERRSIRFAYFVLIVGVIVAGVVLPFYVSGWAIVNAALAAIVVAEIVAYGVTVRSYRRGWLD